MPEAAIRLSAVTKRYRLYSGVTERALDVLGLSALRFGRPVRFAEHAALDGVDLEIAHGERVGIIGRNGAGKTTLLKLIAGNFTPTAGEVRVSGRVQALMGVGLGFHPEFSGVENIRSALAYNGLPEDDIEAAVAEVADFSELGEYLEQPMRTYSQGMQARVMFAAATAVRPDILIVDEVLGAGDAYFLSKCSARMHNLTSGGTTLLLVSHSMRQVVQFCDRGIWLEEGSVAQDGEVLEVAKAYEAHIRELENRRLAQKSAAQETGPGGPPHPSRRRVSRWRGVPGLRLESLRLLDHAGAESYVVASGEDASLEAVFCAEAAGSYPWIAAFNIYTIDGTPVLAEHSAPRSVEAAAGAHCYATLRLCPCLLGNGEYVVSVGIYRSLDIDRLEQAVYYDLWDRSLQFRVHTSHPADESLLKPPTLWDFG